MIKAEEARELSNRIKDYKNKLQNHLNKIEKNIRYHALFMGDRSIFHYIIDENDFQSLTADLSNVLQESGYTVNVIEKGLNSNTAKISW